MASPIPALVEPSLLRWARQTIDLSPVAAARKLGLPDDRIEKWESGEIRPSIAELKKAAALYKRSLAVFFLPEPPAGFDTLRDFRRLTSATEGAWSPDLHAEYRRALVQREHLLELHELDEVAPTTAWHLEPLPRGDEAVAAAARRHLLATGPLPLPREPASIYDHLNTWIAALEAAGVLLLATAGGRVSTKEMRAFSMFFELLPVIAVNGGGRCARPAVLRAHEYAHLLLHTEGLCDTTNGYPRTTPNRRLEARCNAIAGAMLMPAELVLASPNVQARVNQQHTWDYASLAAAAAPFGASAEAFLRRLVTVGRVDIEFYRARRDEFLARYEDEELRQRPKGGDWYRNTVRDLGKGYVRTVADARRRGVIDTYTAARYLGVKVSRIDRLATTARLPEAV